MKRRLDRLVIRMPAGLEGDATAIARTVARSLARAELDEGGGSLRVGLEAPQTSPSVVALRCDRAIERKWRKR